jgi:hypothetical protein
MMAHYRKVKFSLLNDRTTTMPQAQPTEFPATNSSDNMSGRNLSQP